VLRLLKQATLKSAINYANQSGFIKMIVRELEEQEIVIFLLKSSALNANLYSPTFIRLGVDINILVPLANKTKKELVLRKFADYLPPPKLYPFEELYESSWLSKSSKSVVIDSHYALLNPVLFSIPESIMFDFSEPHPEYQSPNIRTFSNEVMLIHLTAPTTAVIAITIYWIYMK
jgi:hypothetical protein